MIIILIIYIIIILIIVFKGIYRSVSFFKSFSIKKNRKTILTSIQIESLPFYFNQGKINLFVFFINFFLISLINFSLVPDLVLNQIVYCIEKDYYSEENKSQIYFKQNSKEIQKQYKECLNLNEKLFYGYENCLKLNKNDLNNSTKNLIKLELRSTEYSLTINDSYVQKPTNRFITKLNVNTYNFFWHDLNKNSNALNYGNYMLTERAIVRYTNSFNCWFEYFNSSSLDQTIRDPYINYLEIGSFLTKTSSISNNLACKYLQEIYEEKYKYENSRITKEELIDLFKILNTYQNDTLRHLLLITSKIGNNTPNFDRDLQLLFFIYDLSSENVKFLSNLILNDGHIGFLEKPLFLEDVLKTPIFNEFLISIDNTFPDLPSISYNSDFNLKFLLNIYESLSSLENSSLFSDENMSIEFLSDEETKEN